MTKFLILVLSFSISACFSQNKLIGNRKVTEVDLGDFYYDVHKDSTSISERMRKEVKPKNLDFFIRLSKSEYKAKYYLFTATDLEERAGKILLKTSKYQVDELQKTIYLEGSTFRNMVYEFLPEEKLSLSFTFEDHLVRMVLKAQR